jgi:ATP-dependent RNA helicase DeaD
MYHKSKGIKMENLKFNEMNLTEELVRAIVDMGFEEATPIQSKAISIIMNGKDVLGQSQTGTGKTAAFGIPCIQKIDINDKRLQAVILCPTRELAIQISEEFRKLLKYTPGIKVVPIYGGQPIDRQISALKKGAQVIIGTPGRVIDHLNRRTLKMENVTMAILDEADEMLDMGFREDIETILTHTPAERQTVLFSATLPSGIMNLTRSFQKDPEHVKVTTRELTVPSISQIYYDVKEKTKLEALCRIMDMDTPKLALVFCNTKRRVDEVVEQLQSRGYFAEGLHGDLKQQQRDVVMKKFRNGTIEMLVATDVAARGIDVDDIDLVCNFDLPQDEEYYVHRIGRTGRAGKSGTAYTFVVGKEIYKLKEIMRYTKSNIERKTLPSLSDVEENKSKQFTEKIKTVIEEGHLTKYINIAESIISEDFSALDIASALLKMHLHDSEAQDVDFEVENFHSYSDRGDRNKGFGGDKKKSYNDKNMIRLFINIGKKKNLRASDIVANIAGESNIPGKVLGSIDIYDEFSFVDVPKEYVEDVLEGMKGKKIKGIKVNIEKAKASNNRK